MRSKGIRVNVKDIQSTVHFLKEGGMMAENLKIKKIGDFAYIPVKYLPEGYEAVLMDFDEFSKKRSYVDYLHLPGDVMKNLPRSMDIVGDVVIIKLREEIIPYAPEIARAIMTFNRRIKTVALDRGVKGEYRVRDLQIIGGDGLETVHRENGVKIYVDLSSVYFSPRLATERARVLSMVSDGETILDIFCGSGAFSILIGKRRKVRIYAVDKNPRAIEGLKKSIELNRITGIIPVLGDIREVVSDLPDADRAIMDLPMESLKFIDLMAKKSKKFHIYYRTDSPENVISEMESRGIRVERYGVVHGYSPRESMYFFDAIRGE